MASFNKVILAGNLTRDPDMRTFGNGVVVTKFCVAVTRKFTDKNTNEIRDETSFVDVDSFGRHAEVIARYLKKGRPILLEGRLKQDTWEDKQTHEKRSKMIVVLESFSFIDSGRRDDNEGHEDDAAGSAGNGTADNGTGDTAGNSTAGSVSTAPAPEIAPAPAPAPAGVVSKPPAPAPAPAAPAPPAPAAPAAPVSEVVEDDIPF
jgi:single-strand DNA-binding protein